MVGECTISYALSQDLQAEIIPLERLYLDPNCPRFAKNDLQDTPDERIVDPAIQEETRKRIIAKWNVETLRSSMEVNGYLPMDRVVVRRLSQEAYVVLEGNRRICAAKELRRSADRDESIPDDIRESLARIPALVYRGNDPRAAWTFQGLRHIPGVSDWPPFTVARLLVRQMKDEGLSLTEVGLRFGLTAFEAGRWLRGYHAYLQASAETDYTEEVDENSYLFFRELFGRRSVAIREWLDWDDDHKRFRDILRLNEFTGWLYPKPENPESEKTLGEWNNRRLAGRDCIRKLAEVLRLDSDAFEAFRRGDLDVEAAHFKALARQHRLRSDQVEEVFDLIGECRRAMERLPFSLVAQEKPLSDLISALKAAREDGTHYQNAVREELQNHVSSLDPVGEEGGKDAGKGVASLSVREKEVFVLLADGFTAKEIAGRLCISPKTVETHKYNIMDKLNVRSVAALTKLAIKEYMLDL